MAKNAEHRTFFGWILSFAYFLLHFECFLPVSLLLCQLSHYISVEIQMWRIFHSLLSVFHLLDFWFIAKPWFRFAEMCNALCAAAGVHLKIIKSNWMSYWFRCSFVFLYSCLWGQLWEAVDGNMEKSNKWTDFQFQHQWCFVPPSMVQSGKSHQIDTQTHSLSTMRKTYYCKLFWFLWFHWPILYI